MALFKRNQTWWSDFSVRGIRYRISLDTSDWRTANQKEKDKIEEAQTGKLAPVGRSFARLAFIQASERYLEERKGHVSPHSCETESYRMKPLCAFFGNRRLSSITADNIKDYQAKRGKHPYTVNHEIKLLCAVLRVARLPVPAVKLLKVPDSTVERILEPEEKLRLFQVASSKPAWQVAYCAALLTVNCSLRPCEIKALQWKKVNLSERSIFILRSKTKKSEREIPLNAEAWAAIQAMLQRAETFGNCAPSNFVFPQMWPEYDQTKPMGKKGWHSAWDSLRKAAGFPDLRYYDLRHQCVTEMVEAGVPEGVIRDVVGHVDPRMMNHYSHVRRAARRAAVESISAARQAPVIQDVPALPESVQ